MMSRSTGGLALVLAAAAAAGAHAHLHKMQIEQVIGGVGGDTAAQAIQLRLRDDGENEVSDGGRLRVWDAAGSNPITLYEFPADVPNGAGGSRILVVSAGFSAYTDPALAADFTLTALIPESYLAAGSLTFDQIEDGRIFWRLTWGGEGYSGPNDGQCTNDDSGCPGVGDFGPPWPGALPSGGVEALQFQGPFDALSTSNAKDYELTAGAVFTNNAGESATVVAGAGCPADCESVPDGNVATGDLLALLGQWGAPGACDLDGNGTIGTSDLLELLGLWGACP